MTDEQIIEMAKQSGLHVATDVNWMPVIGLAYAKKLVEVAAQHEREACAKEADKRLYDYTMLTSNPPQNGAAWSIANAIRARGQRTPEGGKA